MCPFQGSRTIRTEEAVLISLARLSPFLASNEEVSPKRNGTGQETNASEEETEEESDGFSDEDPSDESSVEA